VFGDTIEIAGEAAMMAMVTSGYKAWMHHPQRARSEELTFGAWWKMDGKRWRVSWIVKTGELYASQLDADHFILLGHFRDRKAVNQMMREWFEGNNLSALIHRLSH
jgi:hypothetical protein